MEEGSRFRFFYRLMHFSGDEIYMMDDFSARDAVSADFAELTFNALISLHNHLTVTRGDRPGFDPLPSFVKSNGSIEIDSCLQSLFAHTPAAHSTDWGRELYYLKKYGTDLFGRAGEETREAYERLLRESETDTEIDKDFLKATWHRHAPIDSFRNWRPDAYESRSYSDAAFAAWWSVISNPAFVREALDSFAQAWMGSIKVIEGSEFLKNLREEGRFTSFEDFAEFFDRYHLPLYPGG